MFGILSTFFRWMAGGPFDRIMDTVDQKIKSETDKEKLKTDLIKTYYEQRAGYLKSGGFWLMALFAVPLALWFAFVVFYSMFFCVDCMFPQEWTVAALPPPLDEWSGMIIISIFGVIGVSRFKR